MSGDDKSPREGELYMKIFQRSLYSYVSMEDVDSTYRHGK